VTRVVAFGNCDAASALLLHQPLALGALILANPWTYEGPGEDGGDEPALPPASAIRARYLSRLRDPKSLLRLLRGEIDFRKLVRGLSALKQAPRPAAADSLAHSLESALAELSCPVTILLATGDRTAQAFAESCGPALAGSGKEPGAIRVERLASASHSFAGEDGDWLAARVLAALE
ncbi:MAG TPA: hydrolase 1, exosortase A system-associated, partial [Sphingopyxis sp.]|nr:hydrolase 1, exosortase A system-associated [Sphingopyxis sp.]